MVKNSWKYVIKDMKKRNKWGMKQYGVPLTIATNKNFLQETYEELLDAVVYLRSELQLRKTHLLPIPTKPLDPIMDEHLQQYKIPRKELIDSILDEHSIFHPYPFKENN